MSTTSDRLDLAQDWGTGEYIDPVWGTGVVDNLELLACIYDWLGAGIFLPTDFNATASGGPPLEVTISEGKGIIGVSGDMVLRWRKTVKNVTVPASTTSYVYLTRSFESPRLPEIIVRSISTDAGAATPNAGTLQLCRLVSSGSAITTFDNLPAARRNLVAIADGDISASGGYRMTVDGWWADNVSPSVTAQLLSRFGSPSFGDGWAPIRDGSITAIAVKSDLARTGGTLTVQARKNGVAFGPTAVLDATNTTFKATTAPKDTYAIAAGDILTLQVTTDASWGPTTADIRVSVEIEN